MKKNIILNIIGGTLILVGFVLFVGGGVMFDIAISFIGFIVSAIGLVLIAISGNVKRKTSMDEFFNDSVIKKVKDEVEKEREDENPTTKCKYCGTIYEKKDGRCPNCGASNDEKI